VTGLLASGVAAILQRIAADVDELARGRRVADLGAAAALPDRRAERRRRAAEPDLDFREFCRRSKLPQSERSWDLFADERYQRGETDIPSYKESGTKWGRRLWLAGGSGSTEPGSTLSLRRLRYRPVKPQGEVRPARSTTRRTATPG
jgi:hypothetical protein